MDGDMAGILPIQHVGDWDPVHQLRNRLGRPGEITKVRWAALDCGVQTLVRKALPLGNLCFSTPGNQDSFASDASGDTTPRNSIVSHWQQYNSVLERVKPYALQFENIGGYTGSPRRPHTEYP